MLLLYENVEVWTHGRVEVGTQGSAAAAAQLVPVWTAGGGSCFRCTCESVEVWTHGRERAAR
eukprot:364920-Chlamydomonas_euryale.AAC.4